ncbi:MAG: class I SAM-dependent methyltransferase [Candidatus Azambacteria bacterium]|nr:class I SAM-dependent methyltransferase [Candidatus Azambacteria bacterium]
MHTQYAQYLIEKTRADYDAIAPAFDRTRAYVWKELELFTARAKEGQRVLDFGCGNGRLFELFKGKNISYTGIDQSGALIAHAQERHKEDVARGIAQFIEGAGDPLPFPDASFDCVFSIAAIHHIPSMKKREVMMKELRRVLVPGGTLVVTVWNLWQKEYRALIFRATIHKIMGRSQLDLFDVFVPWKNSAGKAEAQRYYHCFSLFSLKRLVRRAGFSLDEAGYFGGKHSIFNIYVIAVKE